MNRWILGLTILALLTVGGVALASGGFGARSTDARTTCPEAADGALCERGSANEDCPVAVGEVCAEDKAGCEDGAGSCLGRSENRPQGGAGRQCGAGQGRRIGGCRG